MEEQKCFCHFNGYEVKDAKARNEIEELQRENINLLNEIEELQRENINLLNGNGGGIIAISKNVHDNTHRLYYSSDGLKFYRVKGTNYNNLINDASSFIEINKRFYYFGDGTYQYSDDLVNFTDIQRFLDTTDIKIWACFPFYDKVNDKYYVYSSYQYKDGTFNNAVGNDGFYFKIVAQEFTVNEDGTLNFGSLQDIKYVDGSSYIDPSVVYSESRGYVMSMKNEQTCQIEIYSMNNPLQLIDNPILTIRGAGSEAGKLIEYNDIIELYEHDYAVGCKHSSNVDNLPQTYSRIPIYRNSGLVDEKNALREICYSPEIFRHAGVMKASNRALNIIKKLGIEITSIYPCENYNANEEIKDFRGVYESGKTYEVINNPCVIYALGGGTGIEEITLNFRAYFKAPLHLLTGPTKVRFSGDTNTPTSIVNEASNSDAVILQIDMAPGGLFYTPIKF